MHEVTQHNIEVCQMKANIHPKYQEVKVVCSCGNAFMTRSTYGREELHIEVCAQCHPFYTGKQKILDSAGQVDKFRRRYGMK
jgi:large subunit ribosomal protein L31